MKKIVQAVVLSMLLLAPMVKVKADGVPLPNPTQPPKPTEPPSCPWYNPLCNGGGGGW